MTATTIPHDTWQHNGEILSHCLLDAQQKNIETPPKLLHPKRAVLSNAHGRLVLQDSILDTLHIQWLDKYLHMSPELTI